jgi:hypothetical protein
MLEILVSMPKMVRSEKITAGYRPRLMPVVSSIADPKPVARIPAMKFFSRKIFSCFMG